MNWRLAIRGRDRRIGAVRKQDLHDFEVTIERSSDEGRRTARIDQATHVCRLEEQLHVRIGAVLEQQVDDRQTLRCVNGIDRCASAVNPVTEVHRGEQRRFSEDVPLVDIGACGNQLLRQIPVGVHDRQKQRRNALRIGQVDVRLALEQHVDARDAILARRIQQRREPAAVEALGTSFRRDVALIVAIGGTRIHVGALRDQQLHHLRMAARGRPHQRGLSAEFFFRVDRRAVIQQQLRGGQVAGSRHREQRRLAVGIRRVHIRAGLEQHLQHVGVADFGGEAHRRRPVVVGERHIGAGAHETSGLGDVAVEDGPLQRRAAVGVTAVDVFLLRGSQAGLHGRPWFRRGLGLRGPAKAGHYD